MCVSVVVPVFNEQAVLPDMLENLRHLAAEIVFVDGGSSDATIDLIQAAGYRHLSAGRGRASQMNAGAAATSGDVILFLHADTVLPRDALQSVRRAIGDGAVGGSFDVRLDSDRALLRLVGAMISARSRLTRVSTGDQAIFVSRRAFRALGGFRDMTLFEDVDMSRRLRRLGPLVRLRSKVLTSSRRWERHGPVRTILRMWLLRSLYACGVPPERLARHYGVAR